MITLMMNSTKTSAADTATPSRTCIGIRAVRFALSMGNCLASRTTRNVVGAHSIQPRFHVTRLKKTALPPRTKVPAHEMLITITANSAHPASTTARTCHARHFGFGGGFGCGGT